MALAPPVALDSTPDATPHTTDSNAAPTTPERTHHSSTGHTDA